MERQRSASCINHNACRIDLHILIKALRTVKNLSADFLNLCDFPETSVQGDFQKDK